MKHDRIHVNLLDLGLFFRHRSVNKRRRNDRSSRKEQEIVTCLSKSLHCMSIKLPNGGSGSNRRVWFPCHFIIICGSLFFERKDYNGNHSNETNKPYISRFLNWRECLIGTIRSLQLLHLLSLFVRLVLCFGCIFHFLSSEYVAENRKLHFLENCHRQNADADEAFFSVNKNL